VQLVEESLDTNLLNNAIRLRFSRCSVLPGGVSIQETLNNVVILICTNQSVHRLLLPHPSRMYRSVSTRVATERPSSVWRRVPPVFAFSSFEAELRLMLFPPPGAGD